jgi:hypothetical protein
MRCECRACSFDEADVLMAGPKFLGDLVLEEILAGSVEP